MPWLMLIFFGAAAATGLRWTFARPIALLMVATATISIGVQLWHLRRTISDIKYDGTWLAFRTAGRSDLQTRPLLEVSDVSDWRMPQGKLAFNALLGYQITFRDRQKVFIELSTPQALELVTQIHADRWPDRAPNLVNY